MLTKHHRVHFHDSIVHNVCQHSQLVLKKKKKKSLEASYIFSLSTFQFLLPPVLFTITLPSPSSTPAQSPPPPPYPRGVLRPFITVAMVTPQPFDSGPGHSSPPTHLLFLTPSLLLSLSFTLFLHLAPPLQKSLLLLSKHGFRTKITKSQRQVGHMMMGRPPEVFLSPQPLLKWLEQS